MNKVYNTQKDIARGFENFFQKIMPSMRKTQLKIIPFILHGMIVSESLVPLDIAKVLKDNFSLVQIESIIKRIKRLFTNKYFNFYNFYDENIKHVIANYKKKHNDKRVHIIFDHMFSRENYTVFIITKHVGKQGIPLWFRCFKGKECPESYQEELIKSGITYVSKLFNNNFDLIFLLTGGLIRGYRIWHANLIIYTPFSIPSISFEKNCQLFSITTISTRKN